MSSLVHDETPVEFFREQVEKALQHQHVATSAFTEYYLVNLLAGCVAGDPLPAPDPGFDETPLAVLLTRALEADRVERTRLLRCLGDSALFMSGFFADSFRRRSIDVDYYKSMGEYAYGSLSRSPRNDDDAFAEVFGELSSKFVGFMDVLAEVSERTSLTSEADMLRLYEKWLRTGSRRDGRRLIERGILPNHSVGKRFIQ